MFVKSRIWIILKTISVLILSFADAKIFYHKNVCGNKTYRYHSEKTDCHCNTEVLQKTPAIRTVPKYPQTNFEGRTNFNKRVFSTLQETDQAIDSPLHYSSSFYFLALNYLNYRALLFNKRHCCLIHRNMKFNTSHFPTALHFYQVSFVFLFCCTVITFFYQILM